MYITFCIKGGNKSLIVNSMVRTIPLSRSNDCTNITREKIAKALIKEFGSLKGVPGFYEKENGVWTFTGAQGIFLPLFDHEHNLYRLRIRWDHPEVDQNGKEKSSIQFFLPRNHNSR